MTDKSYRLVGIPVIEIANLEVVPSFFFNSHSLGKLPMNPFNDLEKLDKNSIGAFLPKTPK